MPLAKEAAVLAAQHPRLGVGLHFTATNHAGPLFDLSNATVIAKELQRQYQRCCDLLGHPPTHLDSHHHVHLRKELKPFFIAWAAERKVHLRDAGGALYNGAFYGQWYDAEWNFHFAPDFISVASLEKILRGLPDGVTELACHPAYLTSDLDSSYATEREIELTTLLHPRVGEILRELDITVGNFATMWRHEGGNGVSA
jgi:hypothetical protein